MLERIVIFLDNSNIFKGLQRYNIQANYEKLKKLITRGRQLESIFLYEGILYPISPAKANWYKELTNRSGFTIKATFDKLISKGVSIEKKVDINLAIDVVALGYEDLYDTAVLVTGDGDFVPVVKKVRQLEKSIEVWAFRYSLANSLLEETGQENIHYIDDYLNELKI